MSPAAPSRLPSDKSIPLVTPAQTAEKGVATNSKRKVRFRLNGLLGTTARKAKGVATAKIIAAM